MRGRRRSAPPGGRLAATPPSGRDPPRPRPGDNRQGAAPAAARAIRDLVRHDAPAGAAARADCRGRLRERSAAMRRAPAPAAWMRQQGEHRRDPLRAAPQARCRVRGPAPKAARCRISTSRGRRGGAPRSLWHAPRPCRSTDRPTSDGAGRANAPAARSASSRARPPRRRQERRGRCRRTTARRCRPASGRDRPLRRSRRDWSSSW